MKVVRSILLFLVLLLGFVFQIELFQNELGRFDLAYYHSMNYKVEDDKLESFLLDVKEEAKKNNIYVFSTDNYYISRNKAVLDIYGNEEEIKSNIYNVMDLKEKKYVSFASGETTVKYHDFTELKNIKNNMKCMISFIGNDKDILSVYNAVSSKYNVKYFDRYEATENDMIIIVWSMLAFVLVVMNCIEALRRKKEVVIRISLGESVKDVIIKAMLIDVVKYTVVYIVAKRFVYMFFTGDYSWRLALAIYIIGAVISLLPYISFAFYDIKKAFSNADDSKAVLYILYGVKILATAVTIFTIVTNISNIRWDNNSNDKLVEPIKDYNFISLGKIDLSNENYFWNKIYSEDYNLVKPAFCLNILEDSADYILVNDNARSMLQGFKKMMDETDSDADFIIFAKNNRHIKQYEEEAKACIGMFITEDSESLKFELVPYDKRHTFSYLSSGEHFNIATSTNPVLIVQNSNNVHYDGEDMGILGNNIVFDFSDTDILKERYNEYLNGSDFIVTNFTDAYNYQRNIIVRLIRFLSSLCIIVLLMDVFVIFSVSNMEYRLNAMDISLQKVLGYSLFERNKRIIVFNGISDIVLLAVLCIVGGVMNLYSAGLCFVVGTLVLLIEMAIMIYNIIKIENENVYKVLKGGCL